MACNCVLLMRFVDSSAPFQCNTVLERKFVPVTVSVSCEAPASAFWGEIAVMVGAGLPMVKLASLEVPPRGGINRFYLRPTRAAQFACGNYRL